MGFYDSILRHCLPLALKERLEENALCAAAARGLARGKRIPEPPPPALGPGQPHNVMLFPFWGQNPEVAGAPDTGRFDDYAARGGELFEMTSLEEADVAVLAGEWKPGGGIPEAHAYCERALRAGKRVIIFFNNDSDEEIAVEHAIVFRTSGQRSRRRPHIHGHPAWCEDFIQVYRAGVPPIRPRGARPLVGYCGYGVVQGFEWPPVFQKIARRIPVARRFAKRSRAVGAGERIRSVALSAFARSRDVETNFLLRETFWAGAIVQGQFDVTRGRQARVEYVENMFSSDYILCARGAGNFSFHFYETLCSGRIPVFIDTDCLMPHDCWIDWKDFCVWIDESDLPEAANRLVAFHKGLTPERFEELQKACRRLWIDWIAPMGFFSPLHRYLE